MDAKKCLFLRVQLEACVISGLPQVPVLGPLWFTVSIWAIFHFSWLLLRATHITMRQSTLAFSLQFVLKNVEDKMFFNLKEKNGWVVASSCKMSKLPYNLTYCITINESQIKMESTIGNNYREFILAKRCSGLCTVYPATYSAQLKNEAHLALYNWRILSLMDYCWVV